MNQLEALKQYTTVVVDSSNIESIIKYCPQDATTNPSIILESINLDIYKDLIENAINYARKQGGSKEIKVINASDKVAVDIGTKILKYIPGRISTEIDARISFNTLACINRANKLIGMYEDNGIDRSRVLIKLASTWEGICAARELEKDKIKCNLTLIFSIIQAIAAAEAKAFLISPFVGRVYDWYNSRNLLNPYSVEQDPGVKLIKDIYNYYKNHDYNTIIMGASFRKKDQITALAGCDYLTISPNLLNELRNTHEPLVKNLNIFTNKIFYKSTPILESEFRWEQNQNPMAVEKLSEGIRKFSLDQQQLEIVLSTKI
ncbi:transaldolase [Candidatus Pantoea edessiphila]|uniref:Transaldolase n=1 Tax=Candidatus Pantoea edessiphila TaxID=2044610 RepID=A0A2P5SYJ9_9GAMM|nr:transaldolase [Candidatus Pantoea edessiphila]MBK4775501.1 transaldolase [Pantoea sp. Edef]PPI87370.1 transaldolase [Candidatus Pantoea edessiphila]